LLQVISKAECASVTPPTRFASFHRATSANMTFYKRWRNL